MDERVFENPKRVNKSGKLNEINQDHLKLMYLFSDFDKKQLKDEKNNMLIIIADLWRIDNSTIEVFWNTIQRKDLLSDENAFFIIKNKNKQKILHPNMAKELLNTKILIIFAHISSVVLNKFLY